MGENMEDTIAKITQQLDAIATAVAAIPNPESMVPTAQNTWARIPITPSQLRRLAVHASSSIAKINGQLTDDQRALLEDARNSLDTAVATILPQLRGNHLSAAVTYLFHTVVLTSMAATEVLEWQDVPADRLPPALASRLQGLADDIENLMPECEQLKEEIARILEASEVSQKLPTTMQKLRRTEDRLETAHANALELSGKIQERFETAEELAEKLRQAAQEAESLTAQASQTYRMITSTSLAASFEERALKLNTSMRCWVGALFVSLTALMAVGYYRLAAMRDALAAEPFDGGRVAVQVVLSALSIGAPVWFAWMSTKQVGQRFRLAEDYAFKASVSKAYEGYRREAVRIDPAFEKALFASALTRLDEPPLRLVETAAHGSPTHELIENSRLTKIVNRFSGSRASEVVAAPANDSRVEGTA